MKFSEIKGKIKNIGNFTNLSEIKEANLRIVKNTKTGDYWLIENEFLKPVIKSPRECKSIIIKPEDLKYSILMCSKSKSELNKTKVIEYIEWGEKQNYHKRPSCASRPKWWKLEMIDYSIVYPSTHNPSWVVFMNYNYYCIDKVFYGIKYLNDEYLCAFMNSTICVFQSEFFGYSLVGGGGSFITVEDLKKLLIIDKIKEKKLIEIFKDLKSRKYYTIFTEIGIDPSKSIRSQKPNPLPDRKALDDIIFDILGLTQEERNEVYWAVCELVKNRLEKAKSV